MTSNAVALSCAMFQQPLIAKPLDSSLLRGLGSSKNVNTHARAHTGTRTHAHARTLTQALVL